jgi:hypothetical protein
VIGKHLNLSLIPPSSSERANGKNRFSKQHLFQFSEQATAVLKVSRDMESRNVLQEAELVHDELIALGLSQSSLQNHVMSKPGYVKCLSIASLDSDLIRPTALSSGPDH